MQAQRFAQIIKTLGAGVNRRRVLSGLLGGVAALLVGRSAKADHEYLGIVSNDQLGEGGITEMAGWTVQVTGREPAVDPTNPFVFGCNGAVLAARSVVTHPQGGGGGGARARHLLVGMVTTAHPGGGIPDPITQGDSLVITERADLLGDCGDGFSFFFAEVVS